MANETKKLRRIIAKLLKGKSSPTKLSEWKQFVSDELTDLDLPSLDQSERVTLFKSLTRLSDKLSTDFVHENIIYAKATNQQFREIIAAIQRKL